MSDMRKCHLCDRLKSKDEMQDITINGVTKTVACQSHDIDNNVTSFEIYPHGTEPKKSKVSK
jgi:hypothetical protein